jgi:hypothetical protein
MNVNVCALFHGHTSPALEPESVSKSYDFTLECIPLVLVLGLDCSDIIVGLRRWIIHDLGVVQNCFNIRNKKVSILVFGIRRYHC